MLDLGSSGIGSMFFGDDAIGKAYIGEGLVYEAQHGPKVKVYEWTITSKKGAQSYWKYIDLVLGAEYKIDFTTTDGRGSGYIRVSMQNNGASSNIWTNSGSWTRTYSTQASTERIGIYTSNGAVGTIYVTITETINPS